MDLGPTGRTKHTDETGWPLSRVKPWEGQRTEAEQYRQEQARMRLTISLLGWSIVITVLALAGWLAYLKLDEHMSAPERERRIDACATAMASESAREAVEVPIPACDSLSPSERREAAYVYAHREGML